MKKEIRAGQISEIRTADNGRRQFTARVCNYGVPDTYRTSWAPGVFTRSLEKKLPTAVWSHNWDRPIGKVIEYNDSDEGLDVTVEMADPEAVPDARMAISLIDDGIINQYSFAFERRGEEPDEEHRGVTRITEASLDEVSPVLVGSVPGTRTLSVRSDESIPRKEAADLLVKFSQGEIDLADALVALKTFSAGTGEGPAPVEPEKVEKEEAPVEEKPITEVEPEPDPDEEMVLEKLDALARSRNG